MVNDTRDSTPEAEEPAASAAALPFCLVGIGASAGGLEAFMEMMAAIPVDTGMAYVLVLHLPPEHDSMLPEILGRVSHIPVVEAGNDMQVKCDCAYVLPAGSDVEVHDGLLVLTPRDSGPGRYRPVDRFLRSIAATQGHKAVGVILSGTGSDGTLGIQEIKAVGGMTFAQDVTAKQQSMPQTAIATGAVDFVLSPRDIALELARIARHPFVASAPQPAELGADFDLEPVLAILRERVGVDFSPYKPATLYRRIARRIVLHRLDGVTEYLRMLGSSPAEADALYRDILINVTSFFRNPGAFDVLKAEVFPSLTANRSRHDALRVWTLGCSTGEEAYSVAMAYAEFVESSGCTVPMQLFGTDLNEAAIDKARSGVYSSAMAQDVGAERLQRFFVETDSGYRIAKSIREMCVFARHNVLTDPPFSRMDLVSCRNLLIYIGAEMQRKIIPTVHYGLRDQGYLWLGTSETVGLHRDLFELRNARFKIYAKIAPRERTVPARPSASRTVPSVDPRAVRAPETQTAASDYADADRLLMARYAPPSLLVRDDLEIVQYRGNTAPYLALSPGKASLNLLRMLREELVLGVRSAFERARREEMPARQEGLRFGVNGTERIVNVEVVPVRSGLDRAQLFMVLFEEPVRPADAPPSPESAAPAVKSPDEQEIARLKQELAATREYLQSVIEQQDAANEELQLASEEVQSANEELQSINEELETSKEEVQSSNEELATVNDELHARNAELTQTNNDLTNLLSSVQTAIVMVGPSMRIRRYTPVAGKLLNLIPTDVGRPLTDIKLNIDLPELDTLVAMAMESMQPHGRELKDRQGRWYLLRVWPYRTLDNKIDGAVVILTDVDALKRSEQVLMQRTELLNKVHEPIIMWEPGGAITYWNNAAEATYGFTREQAVGRKEHELLMTSPPLESFSEELLDRGEWHGELVHTRRDGQKVIIESSMVVVTEPDGRKLVVEANRAITERKEADRILRRAADDLVTADRHKDEFLAMLAHELRNPLAPLRNVVSFLKAPAARDEDKRKALDIMERQIGSMARLIDDLLDVSRITLSQIELRPERIELGAAMRRVAEQNASYFDLRKQSLQFQLPRGELYVNADPVRLEQVIGNLLNNASKYTPIGGEIVLMLREAAVEAGQASDKREAVISVKDNGIGIAPDKRPYVFDLFMRATRSIDQQYGGLGVGLTLVRRLAELHGGTVEARSAGLGQGSEFIVRLPLAPAAQDANAAAPKRPRFKTPKRRILIVDDNADIVESMAMNLKLANHEVEVADSGEQALAAAVRFDPDVIFMDIGMPGMDGYELARRLRQKPIESRAALVALTGFGHDEAKERARLAGLTDYLVKPASDEDINRVLARL